jgi:phosphate transport system protein
MGVLRALVQLFSNEQPFAEVRRQLEDMLRLTADMTGVASEIYWGRVADPEAGRKGLYRQDIEVNRGERRVRKHLAAHAVAGSTADAMYALQFMSLVKDVERIGDYAKNLAELPSLSTEPLPAGDPAVEGLGKAAREILELSRATVEAIVARDSARAHELTVSGRTTAKECDAIVKACAESNLSAGVAVKLAVGARFYKRIAAHQLNILSSLIMPLHKLDYFDDKSSKGQ